MAAPANPAVFTGGQETWIVDFPVLWVAIDWGERHCVVYNPLTGVKRDEDGRPLPFVEYPQQLWVSCNWYRVKPEAKVGDLATAFHYRRGLYVGPQKCGKGPWMAKKIVEQAAGPVVFAGWAKGGEQYRCSDWGCGCGWVYTYEPGEPMGRRWETPLIQMLATSDDQVENVYLHVKASLRYGPDVSMYTVGEDFTRLPGGGLIESVTSSALSRLGNPIIFAGQDETGTFTTENKLRKVAETQRRGAAGMGGRSIETTNPWDPAADSVAQRTWETKRPDVFRFWLDPKQTPKLKRKDGKDYSFWNARERMKILQHVYQGITHADLRGIEAEALEIGEKDPGQAERFFGNMTSAGAGSWTPKIELWTQRFKKIEVKPGTAITLGFDGSDISDWTGFRCETRDEHQFTPRFADGRPMIWDPAAFGGQVPRLEVADGLAHIVKTYKLVRGYFDPPYWTTEIDAWAEKYGEKVILRWRTQRHLPMFHAAERLLTDIAKSGTGFTHDGCEITQSHIGAACREPRGVKRDTYVIVKPGDGRKIDMTIPSILAHEAAGDVTAANLWPPEKTMAYVF